MPSNLVSNNSPRSMYENCNMAPRLQGQNCKFSRLHCLAIPRRDLSTIKTKPNVEILPESLEVMLEY